MLNKNPAFKVFDLNKEYLNRQIGTVKTANIDVNQPPCTTKAL